MPCAASHRLAVIDGGTAAHAEDKVNVFLSCEPGTFYDYLNGRVRHDACQFDYLASGFFQFCHHEIIDAVFLYASSAIDQHDLWSVVLQFLTESA